MTNHQRKNAKSNVHAGREFENNVQNFFAEQQLQLIRNVKIEIGVSSKTKEHKWGLGCLQQKILVECKSHKWTEGNNMPSAKMTTWDQAMYYMYLAPEDYRKMFVCLKHKRPSTGETLSAYYIRTHGHLIPKDVEIWEYCEEAKTAEQVH